MILRHKIHQKTTLIYYIVYHAIGKNINSIQSKIAVFLPTQEILLLDIEIRTPLKMKSGNILSINLTSISKFLSHRDSLV